MTALNPCVPHGRLVCEVCGPPHRDIRLEDSRGGDRPQPRVPAPDPYDALRVIAQLADPKGGPASKTDARILAIAVAACEYDDPGFTREEMRRLDDFKECVAAARAILAENDPETTRRWMEDGRKQVRLLLSGIDSYAVGGHPYISAQVEVVRHLLEELR